MKRIALLLAAAALPAASLAADTNALWNQGRKGGPAFWLYPVTGGCPDLRQQESPPIVFAAKEQKAEYTVKELDYCFLVPENLEAKPAACKSGSVKLSKDEKANTYSGTYSFVLANGTNPEIPVFLESRADPRGQSKPAWQFAVGRLAHAELHMEYDGKEVFTAPRGDRVAGRDRPYWLGFIYTGPGR